MLDRYLRGSGANVLFCLAVAGVGAVAACASDIDPMQPPAGSSARSNPPGVGVMSATGVGSGGAPAPASVTGPTLTGSSGSSAAPVSTAGTTAMMGAAGRMATAGTMSSAGSSAATAGSGSATSGTGSSVAGSMASAGSGSAGMGGSSAVAGSGGMGGSIAQGGTGSSGEMHMDLGKGDGKDVVTIGDSWMQLFVTGIEQSLDKVAGQMYRHYAVPGTLVLNEQIPNQFTQAVMANKNIKTVVMTGGGNDILTSSCSGESCFPTVDKVSERLTKLMTTDMKNAGVQDVVLIGYTYPADMTRHASLDHSRELAKTSCTKDTMPRCHFIDSSMLKIMLSDGIHPDAAGCDLVAKTVFDLMVKEGMRR